METYKAGETYDVGVEALRTAMTSSQVQDGFFLKRTNNTDQTIDYLVSVTIALNRIHLVRGGTRLLLVGFRQLSFPAVHCYFQEYLTLITVAI